MPRGLSSKRETLRAGQRPTANHQAAADPGAEDDAEHDIEAGGSTIGRFRDREAIGVVGDPHRSIQQAFEILVERMTDQARRVGVLDQAAVEHRLQGYLRTRLEGVSKRLDLHFLIFDAEEVREPALERQPAHQWQLSALEIRPRAAPGARALALGASAGGLALPGRDAAADALAPPLRAVRRGQIGECDSSSKRNR